MKALIYLDQTTTKETHRAAKRLTGEGAHIISKTGGYSITTCFKGLIIEAEKVSTIKRYYLMLKHWGYFTRGDYL